MFNGFKIILEDKNVKAVLINIFGGIVRCDRVAQGVIEAMKKMAKVVDEQNSKDKNYIVMNNNFDHSIAFKAAIAIAGAVFLPKGSRRIAFGDTPISRICSATINLCLSLQTKIGFEILSKYSSLLNVFCKREFSLS